MYASFFLIDELNLTLVKIKTPYNNYRTNFPYIFNILMSISNSRVPEQIRMVWRLNIGCKAKNKLAQNSTREGGGGFSPLPPLKPYLDPDTHSARPLPSSPDAPRPNPSTLPVAAPLLCRPPLLVARTLPLPSSGVFSSLSPLIRYSVSAILDLL